VKIVRAGDCLSTPWKNGGGSTTELAVGPAGASFDTFDWRISMAQVASDGPFSDFPGIDRTLAIVSGNGMALKIGSNAPVTLQRGTEPISFAGDVATSARLIAGEIVDLNVMTRRTRFSHRLQHIRQPVASDFDDHDVAVVLSFSDNTTLATEQDTIILGHCDAAVLERTRDVHFRITPGTTGDCYLVSLRERCAP
jgi:hypothetical protein